MNFNLYIFGNPGGQYNQYPQDYTKDIFSPLCNDLQGSRAVLYRHQDLMHYVYIENLGGNSFIGLCLIFNKIRAKHPKYLFEFLREVVENHCLKSNKYIGYSSDGNIVFTQSAFCDDIKSYDYLKSIINYSLDNNNNFDFEEVVCKYNGTNKIEYVDWSEQNSTIIKIAEECNKIVIEDSLGIQNNKTHQIISSLQSEVQERDDKIRQLNEKISSLEIQKKQYRKVILLFIIVLCCCGGLYFLYNSLTQTEDDLRATTMKLNIANDTISNNKATILNLRNSINELESSLEKEIRLKNEAIGKVNKYKSVPSVIITGGSFSFNDNEYTCNYFTSEAGSRTLKFKVIEESTGDTYTTEISPYLDDGSGSFTVYVNRGMNSSNWYTFEIWLGNRLIGGSRH